MRCSDAALRPGRAQAVPVGAHSHDVGALRPGTLYELRLAAGSYVSLFTLEPPSEVLWGLFS